MRMRPSRTIFVNEVANTSPGGTATRNHHDHHPLLGSTAIRHHRRSGVWLRTRYTLVASATPMARTGGGGPPAPRASVALVATWHTHTARSLSSTSRRSTLPSIAEPRLPIGTADSVVRASAQCAHRAAPCLAAAGRELLGHGLGPDSARSGSGSGVQRSQRGVLSVVCLGGLAIIINNQF